MSVFIPVVLQNYNVGSLGTLDLPGLEHAGYMVVNDAGKATYYKAYPVRSGSCH